MGFNECSRPLQILIFDGCCFDRRPQRSSGTRQLEKSILKARQGVGPKSQAFVATKSQFSRINS